LLEEQKHTPKYKLWPYVTLKKNITHRYYYTALVNKVEWYNVKINN